MQQTVHSTDTIARTHLQAARDASLAADDVRRYLYTDGWDEDDAELGWVDADVVSSTRRLH